MMTLKQTQVIAYLRMGLATWAIFACAWYLHVGHLDTAATMSGPVKKTRGSS